MTSRMLAKQVHRNIEIGISKAVGKIWTYGSVDVTVGWGHFRVSGLGCHLCTSAFYP